MSCSPLSVIRPLLSNEQFITAKQYLDSLSPGSKLTASNFSARCNIDPSLARRVLKELVTAQALCYVYGVRCPECGLLIKSVQNIADIEDEAYCYHCDETVILSPEDVEVFYTFEHYPFVSGQQSEPTHTSEDTAALQIDSLAQLVSSGELDLNALFFSPTQQEYEQLQALYENIFRSNATTKAKGDSLEVLTHSLFSICRHFRVSDARIGVNQIDCYVRNKLYIPGVSKVGCKDSFIIECKNTANKPKAEHLNKLHSILRTSGKQFAIIVSRSPVPRTFPKAARDIYLKDGIVMIWLDQNDLHHIIYERLNLLECLERKIEEVKLNASKNLVDLGLYDA